MRKLVCLVLGHHRSRGRAHYDEEQWQSSCRRCGVAMKKRQDGRWQCWSEDIIA